MLQPPLVLDQVDIYNMPTAIRYGMKIRLRHSETGGLLSSGNRVYLHEGTSAQQIVGGSAKKGPENIWLVKPSHDQRNINLDGKDVTSGAIIRLEHVATTSNLHSHNKPAPLTGRQGQFEVTSYYHGAAGVADDNDDWAFTPETGAKWETGQLFRLKHVATKRILHSHGLADSNFTAGMYEVTALKDGDSNDLFICLEDDQPGALAGNAPGTAADADTGDIFERFRRHWFIALFLFAVVIAAGTWATFHTLHEPILALTERQLQLAEGQLTNAKTEIADLTERMNRLQAANPGRSQDQEVIQGLQSEIRELKERMAAASKGEWPPLSKAQVNDWAERLAPHQLESFHIAYRDGKSLELGLSLYEVARLRKWQSQADPQLAVGPGITIFSHKDDPVAKALLELFKSLDYPAAIEPSFDRGGVIQVTIGQKL